jgi:hypothetical protein
MHLAKDSRSNSSMRTPCSAAPLAASSWAFKTSFGTPNSMALGGAGISGFSYSFLRASAASVQIFFRLSVASGSCESTASMVLFRSSEKLER